MSKKRLLEIQNRKAEIRNGIDSATPEQLDAFSTELDALEAEERQLNQRMNLAGRCTPMEGGKDGTQTGAEERAARFAATNTGTIGAASTRALLTSTSGMIATPVDVANEVVEGFTAPTALCDLVHVVDADGWGAYRVPYEDADGTAATDHTEGAAVSDTSPTTKYVEITPKNALILSKISNQVLRYTPVNYEGYVQKNAVKRLRKYANSKIVAAMKASTLTTAVSSTLNENYLSNAILSYGGDEEIEGAAWLVLNKADLKILGEVRGSDKKAVYEIKPNPSAPSTGTIKDGGMIANYVLSKDVTAGTQYFGSLSDAVELALFSPYSINVLTERYADEGMLGITGSVDLGCGVVKKGGLLKITATKAAS